MRPTLPVLAAIAICYSTIALAQDTLGKRVGDAVAKLSGDEAAVVIRINAKKIDIPAGMKWLEETLKVRADEFDASDENLTKANELLNRFREAGGQDAIVVLYATPAGMGIPIDVTVAIPIDEGKGAGFIEKMKEVLPLPPTFEMLAVNGYVYVGTSERLAHLNDPESATTTKSIASAFDSLSDSSIQVGLFLPTDMRRAVRETIPKLPDEVGGLSGAQIADGIQWMALSVDLAPKPALKFNVQASDVATANRLAKVMQQLLDRVAANDEVKETIPDPTKVLSFFKPVIKNDRVTVSVGEKPGEVDSLAKLMASPLNLAREAAERARNVNSLKQIGLAMHNYYDTHKHFPDRASVNKDGKPLLSWRVQMLPYLEETALYNEFHLDEPWDSDHNKKLIAKMPKIFENASVKLKDTGKTTFVVPIAERSILSGKEKSTFQMVTDGTSATIMTLETDAEHAVIWTKPDDLEIDAEKPTKGLLLDNRRRFLALFADGSVRTLPVDIKPSILNAVISRDGGEVVDLP